MSAKKLTASGDSRAMRERVRRTARAELAELTSLIWAELRSVVEDALKERGGPELRAALKTALPAGGWSEATGSDPVWSCRRGDTEFGRLDGAPDAVMTNQRTKP